MAWIPHPEDIITQRATGTGNMGDVTDKTSVARFGLDGKFVLVWFKLRFTGGTGADAAMALKVDHRDESGLFDFSELATKTLGTTTTPEHEVRIPVEEYPRYVYQEGDLLVFEWTNPDSGTMRWAIEVGLADATKR